MTANPSNSNTDLLNIAFKTGRNLMGYDAANQFAIYKTDKFNPDSNHGAMMKQIVEAKLPSVTIEEINKFGLEQTRIVSSFEK